MKRAGATVGEEDGGGGGFQARVRTPLLSVGNAPRPATTALGYGGASSSSSSGGGGDAGRAGRNQGNNKAAAKKPKVNVEARHAQVEDAWAHGYRPLTMQMLARGEGFVDPTDFIAYYQYLHEEGAQLGGCLAAEALVRVGLPMLGAALPAPPRGAEEVRVLVGGCGTSQEPVQSVICPALRVRPERVVFMDVVDVGALGLNFLRPGRNFVVGDMESNEAIQAALATAGAAEGGRCVVVNVDAYVTTKPSRMTPRAAALCALGPGSVVLIMQREDRGPEACGLQNVKATLETGCFELVQVMVDRDVGGVPYMAAVLRRRGLGGEAAVVAWDGEGLPEIPPEALKPRKQAVCGITYQMGGHWVEDTLADGMVGRMWAAYEGSAIRPIGPMKLLMKRRGEHVDDALAGKHPSKALQAVLQQLHQEGKLRLGGGEYEWPHGEFTADVEAGPGEEGEGEFIGGERGVIHITGVYFPPEDVEEAEFHAYVRGKEQLRIDQRMAAGRRYLLNVLTKAGFGAPGGGAEGGRTCWAKRGFEHVASMGGVEEAGAKLDSALVEALVEFGGGDAAADWGAAREPLALGMEGLLQLKHPNYLEGEMGMKVYKALMRDGVKWVSDWHTNAAHTLGDGLTALDLHLAGVREENGLAGVEAGKIVEKRESDSSLGGTAAQGRAKGLTEAQINQRHVQNQETKRKKKSMMSFLGGL